MNGNWFVEVAIPIVLILAGLACIAAFVRYSWSSATPPPEFTKSSLGIGVIGALLVTLGYGVPLSISYAGFEARLHAAIQKAEEAEAAADRAQQVAQESTSLANAAIEQQRQWRSALVELETELEQARSGYNDLLNAWARFDFTEVEGSPGRFAVQVPAYAVRELQELPEAVDYGDPSSVVPWRTPATPDREQGEQ